jgi:hypothetical protein
MAKFSALRERISKLPEDEQNEIIAMFERATAAKSTPAPTEREIAADHRDLVRTLNKVLKPQTPSPYKGEHDADASQNFIDNQEEYYRVVKLSEDQWVQYTALNLTDEAKSWWRASGLAINTSWATFKKEFLDFFTPPNAVSAARESLETLRQGKRTVAAYTHEFRNLRRRVPSLDDDTALHWYMKGLERETSKEVRLRQPDTLDQAISQATLVHAILFPEGPSIRVNKDQPSPMDIDNMDIRVAINAIAAQVNNMQRSGGYQNNNKNSNGTPRPPKLNPDERAYLIANNGCFRCRKLGHQSPQCRIVFTSQQQRPRQFNNFEVPATAPEVHQTHSQDQSGKDNSN